MFTMILDHKFLFFVLFYLLYTAHVVPAVLYSPKSSIQKLQNAMTSNTRPFLTCCVFIACLSGDILHPITSNAVVSDEISITRFKSSLSELERLDRDWIKFQSKGDDIRRVLGTVYSPPSCDSPLCSPETFIKKFVRNNMDELDFDRFDGPSTKYLRALNQADFLAYSSIFAGYGNGGNSQDYIQQSHDQVKKAIGYLKDMIKIIEQE